MQPVVEYELHDHGAIPWRAVSLNPAQSAVQAHKLPPYLCEWCIAYAHGAPHLLRKTHRALRCCGGHSCTNSASTMNSFVQCHSRRIAPCCCQNSAASVPMGTRVRGGWRRKAWWENTDERGVSCSCGLNLVVCGRCGEGGVGVGPP